MPEIIPRNALIVMNTYSDKIMIDHIKTGKKHRRLRMASNLTLKDVAARIGLTIGQVSHLETGRRHWTKEKSARYLSAFN